MEKRGRGRPKKITFEIEEEVLKLKNEGKSWKQIGEILKISPSTAANILHYRKKGGRRPPV